MQADIDTDRIFAELENAAAAQDAALVSQVSRILAETSPGVTRLLAVNGVLEPFDGFPRVALTVASNFRIGPLMQALRLCLAGDGLALDFRQIELSAAAFDATPDEGLVILDAPVDATAVEELRALSPLAFGVATLAGSSRATPHWSELPLGRQVFRMDGPEFFDPRLSSLGSPHLSLSGVHETAFRIAKRVRATRGLSRKLVLCDLDGLLWPGILGEDRPDGVMSSGETSGEHVELQETIAGLARRDGVQLGIISKNLRADVIYAFGAHPEMSLAFSSFQDVRIGWEPKPDMAQQLLDALQTDASHALFLDDNPAERLAMRSAFPEMVVPESSADPAALRRYLERLDWTWSGLRPAEDGLRAASTAARSKIAKRIADGGDLSSLDMRAVVLTDTAIPLDRAEQMFRRITQFTTMGRILPRRQIAQAMEAADCSVVAVALADRFADHGIIALAITQHVPGERRCVVEHFLVSCRAVGRGVETVLLQCIAERAMSAGAVILEGLTAMTRRNEPGRSVYLRHGFSQSAEDGEVTRWTYPLGESPNWPRTNIRLDQGIDDGL